ncbi:MAG: tetratricopeptide repeat protein [Acetatifactor sp.]|nr:tetratricopeptide repeat protein [Acetatifactor sp.]
MTESYYKPCPEFDRCNELIEKYWESKQYDKCFAGHMVLAEQGYPLAECQIGYFYLEGIGCKKDFERAFYWTQRAAQHGDRDGQYNLGFFYEEGVGVEKNPEKAKSWFKAAAQQGHDLAVRKCIEYQLQV